MFKTRLKELREERNLSQTQLAKEIGVNSRTINGYELGRRQPDYDTLKKLCDFFAVTSDYILGFTDI